MNPTFTDVDDLDKLAQGTEGVEWTHWGDTVNIYGTGRRRLRPRAVGQRRRAVRPAGAASTGSITPAEFLDLNAKVGGWKHSAEMVPEGFPFAGRPHARELRPVELAQHATCRPTAARPRRPARRATARRMNAAYTSGMQFQGDIDIPIIDWRHYLEDELDMHHSHQSFAARQRMLNADGDASNQVIWFTDARPARRVRPDADGVRGDRRVDGQHRRPPGAQRGPQQAGPGRRLVLRHRTAA